jgi:hypothetical protein
LPGGGNGEVTCTFPSHVVVDQVVSIDRAAGNHVACTDLASDCCELGPTEGISAGSTHSVRAEWVVLIWWSLAAAARRAPRGPPEAEPGAEPGQRRRRRHLDLRTAQLGNEALYSIPLL